MPRSSARRACSLTILLALISLRTAAAAASLSHSAGALVPGVPRHWETLRINEEVKSYLLVSATVPSHPAASPGQHADADLPAAPPGAYEVRISHPSFIPVSVSIQLVPPGQDEEEQQQRILHAHGTRNALGRKLLDCDKLVFRLPAPLPDRAHAPWAVHVSASSTAVWSTVTHDLVGTAEAQGRKAAAGTPQLVDTRTTLVYDIVLQPLVLGVLPTDTAPVIAACALLLLVVWCALPWWTDCAVPALTTYLVEGRWEATSGAHAASGGGTRRKAQAA